jgi:hypothetical protein
MSPPLRQLALQFAAVMAVLSLAWPYYGVKDEPLPWPEVSAAIGITALLLASFTRQPWWWRLIHGAFAPLAWAVALLEIDPGWFLLAALILMLVYRGALSGQIPLYLSNRETARTLADLLPKTSGLRCADLGAGLGSMLRPLAAARPDAHFVGVENAPLTWLGGKLLALRHANCEWRWGDSVAHRPEPVRRGLRLPLTGANGRAVVQGGKGNEAGQPVHQQQFPGA